jgi:hypothetical protein
MVIESKSVLIVEVVNSQVWDVISGRRGEAL